MARNPRTASAQEVREWAQNQGYDVGERGRFSTEIVSEFNKAHRRNNLVYEGGSGASNQAASNSRSTAQTSTRTTRNSGDSGTSRRQTRQTESAPAQRQSVAVVPADQADERVRTMVAESIRALSAARNVGGGRKGEPILVTVTTQALAYSA
jgi:hypothetical protein